MTQTNEHKEGRMPRGCGGVFFVIMVLFAAAWGAALGGFVWSLDEAKAHIEMVEDFRPKVGSQIWSSDGELLGEYTIESRQLISLNEMPLNLQKAFMAGEDHLFYEHKGVRPEAVLSALKDYARTGHLRGASTITMQLVRNVEITRIGRERTMDRKIREALGALQLEREYTKDEILELYLNQIFLGGSAHGVESAAQQYFGKTCAELSLGECALLAGLTPAPNEFRPDHYPDKAKMKRDTILDVMLERKFVTQEEHDFAVAEPIKVITPEERLARMSQGKGFWGPNTFLAPYFVEEVRKHIMSSGVSKEELVSDGLQIYTTIDMRLQRAAEEILLAALQEFDDAHLEQLKRGGREEEFVPVAGALVCLDNRPEYLGYIRAMVGGRDWELEKYNTVTQAKRQPGSSIKPFVWAAAIDEGRTSGVTAASTISDTPFVRSGGVGKAWAPQNFDGKWRGTITLRTAIEQSRNIPSIRLVDRLGIPLVRSYLERAGIPIGDNEYLGLPMALGTPVVTVLDHCNAYATFARGGVYTDPIYFTEVKDRDGFTRLTPSPMRKPDAIREDVAYVITYLLEGVVQWGTGTRSAPLKRPKAGKTGTTNEARDVWFCGFTPQFTCVIWIGYRDNRPLGRGANYTGGRLACPIWTDFMIKAHEGLPVIDFEVPSSIHFENISKASGLKGGSFKEAFLEGTSPRTYVPSYEVVEQQMEQKALQDSSTAPLVPSNPSGGPSAPPSAVESTPLPPPSAPSSPPPLVPSAATTSVPQGAHWDEIEWSRPL